MDTIASPRPCVACRQRPHRPPLDQWDTPRLCEPCVIDFCAAHDRDAGDFSDTDFLDMDLADFIMARLMESDRPPAAATVHLPTRGGDLHRWRTMWALISPRVREGHSRHEISVWLQSEHPKLPYSIPLVGRITAAGVAHLLD